MIPTPMIRTNVMLLAICCGAPCGFSHAADGPEVIAAGEWSKPVADARGYAVRGRLVICQKPRGDNRPVARGHCRLDTHLTTQQPACRIAFAGDGHRRVAAPARGDVLDDVATASHAIVRGWYRRCRARRGGWTLCPHHRRPSRCSRDNRRHHEHGPDSRTEHVRYLPRASSTLERHDV